MAYLFHHWWEWASALEHVRVELIQFLPHNNIWGRVTWEQYDFCVLGMVHNLTV